MFATSLLYQMEEIVLATLKYYRTDFYRHDYDFILNRDSANENCCLIWIVRECGTNLYYASPDSCELLDCYKDEKKYYIITHENDEWELYDVTYLIARCVCESNINEMFVRMDRKEN